MNSGKRVYGKNGDFDYLLKYLIFGIIAVGVLLRVSVYQQCNSMFEDEANVARNIFERSFSGLTQPLDYYQYAPPLFLWIIKACTVILGYSEYAYRIYPLCCGILSVVFFYPVLKYYTAAKGIWYALLLLAVGPIYVMYAIATKQYIPDMLVAVLLLWAALKNDINSKSALRLFLIWGLGGSIAIWSSMPSVFILAGVGVYYLCGVIKSKDVQKIWVLAGIGLLWAIQFAAYYFIVLKPQANSTYLQNFHKDYFFYPPKNLSAFYQDLDLLSVFISTAGGHQVLSLLLHIACMVIAIMYLYGKNLAKLLLVAIPLLALLLAAALHQYSLIPRLTLFAMPLMLILIATGMQQLLNTKYTALSLLIVVAAIINLINYNAIKNFIVPMYQEEMKLSLDFLQQKQIKGKELYVEQLGIPAYVYYTTIHPYKNRWKTLSGAAEVEKWDANYDSLAKTFPNKAVMLYGWDEPDKISAQQKSIQSNITLTDSNIVKGSRVYIYTRK